MYQNSKIYKLVSDLTDKIYIGSTTQPLYKRHHEHISRSKKCVNKCKSIELIKLGETRIELIEDYPCERKEQLNAREGYYIKLNNDICVNVRLAGQTRKEYYDTHKEEINEWRKQYDEDNKEKLSEKKKEYYEANKQKIAEREKQYREANKEKIAERMKKYREAKKANKLLQQQQQV
jgi:hypothetical protein